MYENVCGGHAWMYARSRASVVSYPFECMILRIVIALLVNTSACREMEGTIQGDHDTIVNYTTPRTLLEDDRINDHYRRRLLWRSPLASR